LWHPHVIIIDGITGFLVDSDNPEVFCEKILDVLAGVTKNAQSSMARRELLQQFDPVAIAKHVGDL